MMLAGAPCLQPVRGRLSLEIVYGCPVCTKITRSLEWLFRMPNWSLGPVALNRALYSSTSQAGLFRVFIWGVNRLGAEESELKSRTFATNTERSIRSRRMTAETNQPGSSVSA